MHFNRFEVIKVERIENFRQWQSYATKRAQVRPVAEDALINDAQTAPLRLPYGVNADLDKSKNEMYVDSNSINAVRTE